MKIALVILHADPTRGGAERYTMDLADALARHGHDVTLLAATFSSATIIESESKQPSRVKLSYRGLTRSQKYRSFLASLDNHLDQVRYDVVHAMLPVNRCDIYHPHAGMAVEARAKWSSRFNRRGVFADVEARLLSGATCPLVICLSNYVKQAIARSFPLIAEQYIEPLFNAVGIDYFDPTSRFLHTRDQMRDGRKIGRDEVVALIVAMDFERKGVYEAIEATRLVNRSRPDNQAHLRLLVVGHGKHGPSDEDVVFAGTNWKIVLFYNMADFFVLPTKHDPCSLVVLEALAMGLPVISTKFNGACEIMTDGVHGYVLDNPLDMETLADRMRRLMDSELRSQMSAACLQLRPALSYDTHLKNLLAIYERRTPSPLTCARH